MERGTALSVAIALTFAVWWVLCRPATPAEQEGFIEKIAATHGADAAAELSSRIVRETDASLFRVWWLHAEVRGLPRIRPAVETPVVARAAAAVGEEPCTEVADSQ